MNRDRSIKYSCMDLTILPTQKIINTYKRYSLPVPETEPTDISKLQFFYIGTQTRNIEKLKEYFEFGYTAISAESAIFTLKRLLKKGDAITIPVMIIAEGMLGTEHLVELHQFIYSHKILADVPFIVEGTGLSKEELARFKGYTFIDELLFLNFPHPSATSSVLANAETRVVYRQESDQLGSTAATLGLTGTEQSLLPTLGTGQGLWRIKHRSFVVQHQLHPAELELFDTAGRMNGAL